MQKTYWVILLICLGSIFYMHSVSAESWFIRNAQAPSNIMAGQTIEVDFSIEAADISISQNCIKVEVTSELDSSEIEDVPLNDCCAETYHAVRSGKDYYTGLCQYSALLKKFDKPGYYTMWILLNNMKNYGLFVSVASSTDATNPDNGGIVNPVSYPSIVPFVEGITNIIFWLATSLAVFMIMAGGFILVTSAGNPQKTTKGINMIIYAIAGFALMSLAKGIVALIQTMVGINVPK